MRQREETGETESFELILLAGCFWGAHQTLLHPPPTHTISLPTTYWLEAMSVVQQLRRNDPARTCIHIRLRHETSDADLAQALEQNPFVTDIILDSGRRAANRLGFFAAGDCDACQP